MTPQAGSGRIKVTIWMKDKHGPQRVKTVSYTHLMGKENNLQAIDTGATLISKAIQGSNKVICCGNGDVYKRQVERCAIS